MSPLKKFWPKKKTSDGSKPELSDGPARIKSISGKMIETSISPLNEADDSESYFVSSMI
jgi:hypothetical protein